MLLSPSPFGPRLAIRPNNLPLSYSRLRRGYEKAPRGALEVDVLHWERVGVVAVELAAAFCATDPDPVRSLVAGTPAATDLDESLDDKRLLAVVGLPVVSQTMGDGAEEMGGEVGHMYPRERRGSGGLPTTRCRRDLRCSRLQPMQWSRSSSAQAEAAKLIAAMGAAVAVVTRQRSWAPEAGV